jgi:hypothetical protein
MSIQNKERVSYWSKFLSGSTGMLFIGLGSVVDTAIVLYSV